MSCLAKAVRAWPRWSGVVAASGLAVYFLGTLWWFPIGLATVCGAGLFGYCTLFLPDLARFFSGRPVYFPGTSLPATWLSQLPEISLLVWSVSVLLATVAFHFRTRTRCLYCGSGPADQGSG
jgi:hypothetical protein